MVYFSKRSLTCLTPIPVIHPTDITANAARILSPHLARDITQVRIDVGQSRTFTDAEMQEMRQEIDLMLEAVDREVGNAYHNRHHAHEVAQRSLLLLDRLEIKVPVCDRQVVEIAALFHDYRVGHPDMRRKIAQEGLTAEEYAAIYADLYARKKGFSVYQRILLQGLIIGTSHGKNNVWPATDLEKVIALADIGGFSKPWPKWIQDCTGNMLEYTPEQRPKTLQQWALAEMAFLSYVRDLLERMPPDWQKHCWLNDLVQKEQVLNTLLFRPEDATIVKERRLIDKSMRSFL